jgi:hypothetical protein
MRNRCAATLCLDQIEFDTESYVRSLEILNADCRVVGMTSSGGVSGPKVPEIALPTFILSGYISI